MTSVIYPKYYYYRAGESDLDWIITRMKVIPEKFQQEVADEYERLYRTIDRKEARRVANTYLNDKAKNYRNKAA